MSRYFGGVTCEVVQELVRCMGRALGETAVVSFATIEVLLCEVRQAINRYGLKSCWVLVHLYEGSSDIRGAVSTARARLQLTDEVFLPHTIQLLEVIREHAGISLAALRRRRPGAHGSIMDLVRSFGRHRICPKVELDGIVEWRVLARELGVAMSRGRGTYRDLEVAAAALGVSVWGSRSGRVSKEVLRRRVAAARVREPQVLGRTRTFEEIEQAVSQSGASTRRYVGGKRLRLTRNAMEEYLAQI